MVVVPPHQLKSIYELPESSVDAHWVQSETIQAKYTVGDPEIFSHAFHVNVIRNQITRNLDSLTGDIVEEIGVGFNKHWGTDEEIWAKVPAWPSCLQIVAKAVNRVFVGTPHCMCSIMLPCYRFVTLPSRQERGIPECNQKACRVGVLERFSNTLSTLVHQAYRWEHYMAVW